MRHFFLRDSKQFPVGCIATEEDSAGRISYALSICNPLDIQVYSPDRARHIAEERLKKFLDGGYFDSGKKYAPFEKAKIGRFDSAPGENAKLSLLTLLASDLHLPKRFRNAAIERRAIMTRQLAERQAKKAAEAARAEAT